MFESVIWMSIAGAEENVPVNMLGICLADFEFCWLSSWLLVASIVVPPLMLFVETFSRRREELGICWLRIISEVSMARFTSSSRSRILLSCKLNSDGGCIGWNGAEN